VATAAAAEGRAVRFRTFLPVLAALICTGIAGVSFVELIPQVRAVDALTLFASAFGAGASFTAAVVQARRKRSG
jgi:hypothetical protein